MDTDSMNFHNIVNSEIEHHFKIKKENDSILLLKRKMCKTHDLIRQYSENIKEIGHLKSDLEVAKKEAKHMISNYTTAMDKIRELEIKLIEAKQSNEKSINTISELEINKAADKQIIRQLTCKIKDLEEKCSAKDIECDLKQSCFEDKIKNLEQELRKLKTLKKREEKINVDAAKPSISTKSSSDIGINVSLDELKMKYEVQDQSIMTDEFYNMKDDPHPLFCSKCEAHLSPDLTLEKIYKTMSTFPKLIDKDLSPLPKKIHSPSFSISSTYSSSTNRNEDAFSKVLSGPHLSPNSPYNDSVVDNPKFQSGWSSATTQICENVELGNVDVSYKSVVTNPCSNLTHGSTSTTFTFPENRICKRENFCSENLLTKHSSSIKEMERKIRSLESKMKKFRRLKTKINANSRCHCINHKDDVSINSNLISMICKGVAEYFDEKRDWKQSDRHNVHEKIFSRKVENFDEKNQVRDTCRNKTENATKTILQSEHTLLSVHKDYSDLDINTSNTSLHDIDETDREEFVLHEQNTLHSAEVVSVEDSLARSRLNTETYTSNNLVSKVDVETINMNNQMEAVTHVISLSHDENSMDCTEIDDINVEKSEIERKSQSIHKDGEIYTSNNDLSKNNVEDNIDMGNETKIGTRSLPNNENSTHDKIVNINVEKSEIERKIQSTHKNKIDKVYASNNVLNKDNIDMDNQTEIETTFLTNNENSTNYADGKTVNINTEKGKIMIKRQNVQKGKVGDRLLKKIRGLKRKTQANSYMNKQENIESCSNQSVDHNENNELMKKPRLENGVISKNALNLIKSLKRSSDTQAESINKQEDNKLCSNHYELAKKLRIAHTPKTLVPQLNVTKNDTHCMIRKIGTINSCHTRRKNNGNQQLIIQNNVLHNNSAIDTANDLQLEESIPLKTSIITLSKDSECDKLCETLEVIETRKEIMPSIEVEYASETLGNKNHNDHEISEDTILNNESSVLHSQSNVLEATRNEDNNEISNKLTEVLRSPSPKDNGTVVEDYTNDGSKKSLVHIKNSTNEREETCINNETIEIQAVKTQSRNVRACQRGKETKFIDIPHYDVEKFHNNVPDEATEVPLSHHDVEESQTPMSRLIKYIKKKGVKKHTLSCKQIRYVRKIADEFVKKQLERLKNSAWEDSIHDDIIRKLKSTCGPRIIAKCIVMFLLKDVDHSEVLDKTFTPPAPMMTTFEQKIIALLYNLEMSIPTVIYFVQAAIEYHLFRLNSDLQTEVSSLTRIYVVLSRIQKDREKIRMMCCNALYCMGRKSISVLYTVLTCWPEVLPNAEANKELLPKCIAFLVRSQQNNSTYLDIRNLLNKFNSLKHLISGFYNYSVHETTNDIVQELTTALKKTERIDGLDTAIILVAKQEGASWTYKNIIQSVLLPMIIKNEHPCIYSAFSLLGKLLRAFPLQDEDKIVQEISEQLCDIIQSGQGSHDQQEGVISALLSLSRHKFELIALPVIEWMPSKSLRPIIDTQLRAFVNTRSLTFWKKYLNSKHRNHIQSKM